MKCAVDHCQNTKIAARGFCSKHYQKNKIYGDPLAGYEEQSPKGSGSKKDGRYHRRYINGEEKLEHVIIAENALGRQLPKGAIVHHADENKHNNSPNNLVICPDNAYHRLLHKRINAMKACGDPNKLKCKYCGEYDQPENMYVSENWLVHYHRTCSSEFEKTRVRIY